MIKIGRFQVDFETLSKGFKVQINIKKTRPYFVKLDNDAFRRKYIIFKVDKNSMLKPVFQWCPKLDGAIKLEKNLPYYIEEFLYELFNFEFPYGNEKDIKVSSLLHNINNELPNKVRALLVKNRLELIKQKELELIGPCGIYCHYYLCDSKNEENISKVFHIDQNKVSVKTSVIDSSVKEGTIDHINGGQWIFENLKPSDYITKILKD